MHPDIRKYNTSLSAADKKICVQLATEIDTALPMAESKIWHRTAVWFLDGNPVVGYSKLKDSVQLLFWSGQSFDEPDLEKEGTFKAAQKRYTSAEQIKVTHLRRWLRKAKKIQWNYKDVVKNKGKLLRIR